MTVTINGTGGIDLETFNLDEDSSGNLIIVDPDGNTVFTYDNTANEWQLGDNIDLNSNDLEDGSQTVWDTGSQEVPDSAMGSIANSTLANDSITLAGQSVALGGSDTLGLSNLDDYILAGNLDASSNNITSVLDLGVDSLSNSGSPISLTETIDNDGSDIVLGDNLDVGGNAVDNAGSYSIGGDFIAQSVVASGQVTLSSGEATVDTGISAVDATFNLALGVDDPDADVDLSGRLFWDDSAGTYKIDIVEATTSVGNPTANYDVVRVR